MRKILFFLLVLSLIFAEAGCGDTQPQAQPAGATSSTSGTLIIESQAGLTPYLCLVQEAKRSIDVNSYLLTDSRLVSALVQKAQSGVAVRAIVAGNPYRDQKAVSEERAEFSGTKVLFKLAPAQFEKRYVFDHAKYVVVDPDQGGKAILGSSNMDYSGLGGGNREYDYETTDPGVVANLAAVFNGDWSGKSVQLDNPGPLVLSPGAEPALVGLIQRAKKRLYIESEELGNDWPVLDALAAAAKRGVQVELVLPSSISPDNRRNAEGLVKAGAHVRYLSRPYVHAKLIIADDQLFLGSENISVSGLDKNREVGVLIEGGQVGQAVQWFEQDFGAAGK